MPQDTAERTNPAKRLLAVLDSAQKHGNSEGTLDVWQSVLGGHSLLATIDRLRWLDRQFEETERQIRRIREADHQSYLQDFASLRKVTDPKLFNQQWSNVRGYISPVLMTRLEFCSLALDEQGGELKVEEETLRAIQEDVDELLNEVLEGNLPISLRDLIVRLLQAIQNAIVEYRLGGVAALEEGLEAVVGAVVLRKSELLENEDEPRVRRLLQIVQKVFRAVQTARTILSLPGDLEEVRKLLQ